MPLTDSLVAWWEFDGGGLVDSTGNFTLENAGADSPTLVASPSGRGGAFSFVTAAADSLSIEAGVSGALAAETPVSTFYAASTLDAVGSGFSQTIVGAWPDSNKWRILWDTAEIKAQVDDSGADVFVRSFHYPDANGDTLYHVFLEIVRESAPGAADGSATLWLYSEDGTLINSNTVSGLAGPSAGTPKFGVGDPQASAANGFTGRADVVAAWSRSLTEAERVEASSLAYADFAAPPNSAPEWTTIPNVALESGETEVVDLSAFASDAEGAVTYSLVSGPPWATLEGSILTLAPQAGDPSGTVAVRATDAGDPPLTADASFRAVILPSREDSGGLSAAALGWWQFDRIGRLSNEVSPGTFDLEQAGSALPSFNADGAGIEYEATFADGTSDALQIAGSNVIANGFKPTGSDGSSASYYLHPTFDAQGSGTDTYLGKFGAGGNEFRVFSSDDEIRFSVVDREENTELRSGVSPTAGQRVHVFAGWMNESSDGEADGIAWLRVYGDDGALLGEDMVANFGHLSADGSNPVFIGGESAADTNSGDVSMHAVAAFNRGLSSVEEEWIVNGGAGRRWWDLHRAGLVADGETFGSPSGGYFGQIDRAGGLFGENHRLVYLSDSYGWLVFNGGRPIAGILQGVAPDRWSAIQLPYDDPSIFGTFASAGADGVNMAPINEINEYHVEGGNDHYAATPYHGVSAVIGTGYIPETPIFRVEIDRANTQDGDAGTFEDPSEPHYAALVTYRRPASNGYTPVLVNGELRNFNGGVARQAASSGLVPLPDYDEGSALSFDISGATGVGADQYLDIIGVTIVKVDAAGNPRPGFYLSGIADNSWAFGSFGNDMESTGDKVVSAEQMRYWIDATSIDDSQDVTFLYYLDGEFRSIESHVSKISSAIDVLDTAHAASKSTGRVTHLVVIPPVKANGNDVGQTVDGWKACMYRMRKACEQIAADRPNVAWVSIPEFTEYSHWTSIDFDRGGFDLEDYSGSEWLIENGFSTITYGGIERNLATTDGTSPRDLMTDGAHPDSEVANVFFNRIWTDVVPASSGRSKVFRAWSSKAWPFKVWPLEVWR